MKVKKCCLLFNCRSEVVFYKTIISLRKDYLSQLIVFQKNKKKGSVYPVIIIII